MGLQRSAVTGGSGRLGRYVVAERAGRYEVTVLDIAPPADHPGFAEADTRALGGLTCPVVGERAATTTSGLHGTRRRRG